ncbi:hypothetical protein WIS52_22545 [Pseudonocardia nematodicida]|uniref:PE domain-containing protein n=1 Tax=Pseudonocardia nematodicida TaxID=1206997 RepID=A0ABV1KFM1_9PSEU
MSLSSEQQRAIDDLVSQVDVESVLKVASLLRRQAEAIENELLTRGWDLQVGLCGKDPISEDARRAFQTKIDRIVATHWAHCVELHAAVDALRRNAEQYAFDDSQLEAAFGKVAIES